MMRRFWTAACAALLAIPAAAGGAGDRGEFTIFLNGANRGREKYHIETSAKKHYWGILSETFFKEPWPQAKRGYIDLHFYPEYYRDLGTGELLEYKYRMKVEDYAETDLVEADQSAREVVDQDRQLFDFSQQYKQNTQDVMQDRVDLGVNSGLLRRMANGLHFEQTKISLTRVKDEAARGPVLVLDPYAFALFIPLLDQLRGEGPVWSLPIALPQYMRFKPGRVEYNGILKVTVSGKPYFLKHYDVRVQDALYASFWTDKAGKIVQISVPKDGMMAVLARYTPAGFEKAEPRITRAVILLKSASIPGDSLQAKQDQKILEDQIGLQKTRIYPNPNKGLLKIDFPSLSRSEATISVYNSTGKLIVRKSASSFGNEVDLSSYPSGFYVMTILIGQEKKEWKIIKE